MFGQRLDRCPARLSLVHMVPRVAALRGVDHTSTRPGFKARVEGRRRTGSAAGGAIADRREVAPVGLDVDQRRARDAFEAAHDQSVALAPDEAHRRQADRVRPDRRAQRKRAAGAVPVVGVLQDQVAPRQVQPVEDVEARIGLDPLQRAVPWRIDDDDAVRPVRVSRWPMKASVASAGSGASVTSSCARIARGSVTGQAAPRPGLPDLRRYP